MCGGLEFLKRKSEEGSLGLLPPDFEIIRVTFPNPKAALRVDSDKDLWLPWGRRKEEAGDWPEGGWARAESLTKAYWTRWEPELMTLFPSRWMEKDRGGKSHWFELESGLGIACLSLQAAPGRPLYVVTVAAPPDFLDIHDRMPRIVAGFEVR